MVAKLKLKGISGQNLEDSCICEGKWILKIQKYRTSNKKGRGPLDLSRLADLCLCNFFNFSDTWHLVSNLENQNKNQIKSFSRKTTSNISLKNHKSQMKVARDDGYIDTFCSVPLRLLIVHSIVVCKPVQKTNKRKLAQHVKVIFLAHFSWWYDYRFQFGRIWTEKFQKINLPLKDSVLSQDFKNHIAFDLRWTYNNFWPPLDLKIWLSNLNISEIRGRNEKPITPHRRAPKSESLGPIKKIN